MKYGNNLSKITTVLLIILTFTVSADQLLIKLMFTVSASQTKIDWDNVNWVLIDEDDDEQGGENWRDVLAAYVAYDDMYLYLKLITVEPPRFPTSPQDRDDDKYRWFFDLDGNMYWQGNVLYEAEYLLSVQDKDDNGVGEMYLLFDSDNDGEFNDEQWGTIQINSTDGGFRIIRNHLEVYISWSKIGGMPSVLWLSWCTDKSDQNLNQCPNMDRAETAYGTVIPLGSISGYKWEDLNGDGSRNDNEPLLPGWEIRLQSGSISLIAYTNSSGYYQFLGLPNGTYTVSEAVQDGWIQTYPGNNSYIMQIISGQQFAGKNFGNFKLGVKGGYVWNDSNGDGLWNPEETALSDWEVNLYNLTDSSWKKIKVAYTNSSGFYEFTNLEPRDYMVNVTVHSGYILTWPSGGFYSFSVRESGFNEVDNNFGFMKSMAGISIIKTANTTFAHVDDTIKYSYKVINTGNVPLTIQYIYDDIIGRLVINKLLKPSEWIEETAIYNVAQNSPDPLMNKAVVYANYTDQQVSAYDTLTIDILNPNIEVSKSGPKYAHEGDTITYTIMVENTGDCTLHNIVVKDEILGFEETIKELTKGEERTFSVTYTIPERSDDIINIVKAKGEDALGWEVSNSASWTVDVLHPAIDVIKRANVTMIHVGDWVEYNVTVVNIGDCPLYNVNIADSLLGIIWTGDLSVSESRIFNVTYTVMVGDPDPLNNTVTATGVDALGMSVSDEDSCVISVLQAPPQKVVVTFNATGLSSDVSGVVVLSVDGGNYTCGELPRSFEWDVGSKHAFAWISPVNVSDGKRYIWTLTSGLSKSQHGEITVPAGGGYVTGNYKIQYLVSFIQEGSAMPVNVEYQIDNGPVVNCTIPFDTWLDSGVKISYNYSSIAYGDAGTRYILTEVDPTSPQIVNAPLTIDGKYKAQHYLEVVSVYGEPCPASGWFDAGTSINASVSSPWPANAIGTRHVCTGWNGTGSVPPSGTEKSVTFTINESSSIIWNWKTQHYLEVQSSYGVTGGEGWYDENATAYASLNTGLIELDGTRHVFVKWADNATGTNYAKSDPIIMDAPKTATSIWKTQYYLAMKGDPSGAGTVSPSSGWYDADSRIQISATAASGYRFYRWIGSGSGSYSGTDNPASITMYGPITETANFVQVTPTNKAIVTFSASGLDLNASGAVLIVDGVSYVYSQLPLSFTWDVGTSHSFAWLDPINSIVYGKRYIWSSTHGLSTAKSGFIVVSVEGGWVNATYKTQYYLTVISQYDTPSGEGWYDDGDEAYASLATGIVNLTSGMRAIFVGWSGDASGTDLLSESIMMDAPKTAIANWVIQWLIDIEVTPEEAGSIPGEGWYNNCTTITFEAPEYLPSEEGIDGVRYRFDYWTVDGERFDGNVISVHANTSHTIISIYVIQCGVIFNQTGLDQSANETVVIVDGSAKKLEELPFTLWVDVGNLVNYTYKDFVSSNIDGKQFELKSIIGPSSPVLVTEPVNITGNYQISYYLSVISEYGSPRGSGWYPPSSEAKFGVTTPVDHGNRTLRVFLKWYGDVSIFEPEGIIVMNKPSIVIASWETQYLVTFNTTLPNKYILRVPGVPETLPPGMDIFGMYYPAGERITVGPAPIIVPGAEGVRYTLACWKLDGEILTYDVNMSFVVKRPHNVAVLYDAEYLLNVSAVGVSDPFTATIIISSGTSIIRELKPTSPVKEWFRQGAQLAITTSTPNKIGHGEWAIFREWTGHLQTVNRSIQLTMISPRTLNVVFFKVNPVAESIPYSIVAGLISMLLCIISARRSAGDGRRRRSATSGIIVSAVALIVAAIVSVIIATGYGININELLDFTNWAVIFLILEDILLALVTAAIVRKVQRQEKTS